MAMMRPFIDNRHAVAEPFGLFDVVRGQQNRALVALQVLDQLVNLQAHLRVEARRRLVQKQHLRIVHQRQRQRHPLLLPARQLRVIRVALLPELQAFQ